MGYDQCFVLATEQAPAPRFAARALDLMSGRILEIHTTQPGLQLYTGNKLNGSVAGRNGVIYRQSAGFAFEPQGFPAPPSGIPVHYPAPGRKVYRHHPLPLHDERKRWLVTTCGHRTQLRCSALGAEV